MIKQRITKICFFGPSGSGKTTAMDIVFDKFNFATGEDHLCLKANIAEPLHNIVYYAYGEFNLLDIEGKVTWEQDGKFLQFLVEHFGVEVLKKNFIERIEDNIHSYSKKNIFYPSLIFVNSDCRNNCYSFLKDQGFTFIEVKTDPYIRLSRLQERKDITKANLYNKIEKTDEIVADYIVENNGTLMEFKQKVYEVVRKILSLGYI